LTGTISRNNIDPRNVELAVARIAERHRLEAESLALQAQPSSPLPSPRKASAPQTLLDRTSRLTLPNTDRERTEILGPTRDLLVSGSGKVVGAVKKPLKGLGNFVFGEGGESPPDRPDVGPRALDEQARDKEEEAAVRLANAEIERAERAEREQRGQTLEMLVQMFPGMLLILSVSRLDLDREVVEAIIIAKEGRVGVCIDICLEMSGGIEISNDPHRRAPLESQEAKDMVGGPSSDEQRNGSTDTSDLLGLDGESGLGNLKLEDDGQQHEKPSTQVELMD
jgi:hypothetical protein